MNRLFGNKNAAPKPSLNDALTGIDGRVSSLDVQLSKLNAELTTYQQKLARMRDGPGKNALKQRALKLLTRRKQLEAQKDQLESQSFNITQTTIQTENLRNVMTTVDALKTANKELKRQYGKIDIDKIEQLQDEMADLMDVGQELQEAMSRNYSVPDDISESELDAELEALGEELEFEQSEAGSLPSYLQEDSAVPSFIDEPVPETPEKQKEAAA